MAKSPKAKKGGKKGSASPGSAKTLADFQSVEESSGGDFPMVLPIISFLVIMAALIGGVIANMKHPMNLLPFGGSVPEGYVKRHGYGWNSFAEIKERAAAAECKDRESADQCARMAYTGQCQLSPGWMSVMCAASCDVCELLDPQVRCNAARLNLTMQPAFNPGDLDVLFENLPSRFPQYNVTYLSKPPTGPWILQFDNFLSDAEINAMLENVGILKRSTDQGSYDASGYQSQSVSKGRTSENAWCMGDCEKHPLIAGVRKRISDITTVPEVNFENFQMLRYQIGQEYQRHHDMSPMDIENLSGPRVLTFFLYLSDVEAGGGTRFTDLDPPITMTPRRGSAILWPSVMNEDPMKQEPMTFHQALPVIRGTKFAANTWIHQFNYRTPNFHGCTGSFA